MRGHERVLGISILLKCKQLNDISYERTKELKYKSLFYFFRKKDSKEIAIFMIKRKTKSTTHSEQYQNPIAI
jgi:hypothetical protein